MIELPKLAKLLIECISMFPNYWLSQMNQIASYLIFERTKFLIQNNKLWDTSLENSDFLLGLKIFLVGILFSFTCKNVFSLVNIIHSINKSHTIKLIE